MVFRTNVGMVGYCCYGGEEIVDEWSRLLEGRGVVDGAVAHLLGLTRLKGQNQDMRVHSMVHQIFRGTSRSELSSCVHHKCMFYHRSRSLLNIDLGPRSNSTFKKSKDHCNGEISCIRSSSCE